MKNKEPLRYKVRRIFDFDVRQDVKMGFLCLTDLQREHNRLSDVHGWKKTRIQDHLASSENIRRAIKLIVGNENPLQEARAMVDIVGKGTVAALKLHGFYKTVGRAENRLVWCDPVFWLLLASELNPIFFAKTIALSVNSLHQSFSEKTAFTIITHNSF